MLEEPHSFPPALTIPPFILIIASVVGSISKKQPPPKPKAQPPGKAFTVPLLILIVPQEVAFPAPIPAPPQPPCAFSVPSP